MIHKEIDLIEFADIVEFCKKGKGEGTLLDYKREIPKTETLAKTIAAMANTHGGTIIVGVKDDGDYPEPPFDGVDYSDHLRQQITDIYVQHISPPVFCEVKVARSTDGSKCFIFIRVPQSISTPHAVNRTHIYIRTGQKSNPEDLAAPERLSWLYSHRKQSEELRSELVGIARDHYDSFKLGCRGEFSPPTVLTTIIVPHFPQIPLCDYQLLEDMLAQRCAIPTGAGGHFPQSPNVFPKRVNQGVLWTTKHSLPVNDNYKVTGRVHHAFTYLSSFGLLRHSETVHEPNNEKLSQLELRKISFAVLSPICFAIRFFQELGYGGAIDFCFTLEPTTDRVLEVPAEYIEVLRGEPQLVSGTSFIVRRTKYVGEAAEHLKDFLSDILEELLWSLDFRSEQYLHDLLTDNPCILATLNN
ncbi:MAG: ATP-binding protein [Candidatus Obscuribacterales bacterium]|nr:ATP-binding protein [Candidatus Obscuribacterales bacterium]